MVFLIKGAILLIAIMSNFFNTSIFYAEWEANRRGHDHALRPPRARQDIRLFTPRSDVGRSAC